MDFKQIHVSDNDINITDSYLVPKREFDDAFDYVENAFPDNSVMNNRSRFSLSMEWITHNALYGLNIERSRTKDVDLNYPMSKWMMLLYDICGILCYLFVK